jgi:hypothetical protein
LNKDTSRANPSFGGDFFSTVQDNEPATLGAITFQSGGTYASDFCAREAALKVIDMNVGRKATGLVTAIYFAGLAFSPASAQDSKDRAIEQYTCKDIMRESGASRDVAIAFLRGFLLGKSVTTKFNLDVLHKQLPDEPG